MQKPATVGDRKERGALGCGILAPSSLVAEAVFGQMLLLGIKPKTKSSFSSRSHFIEEHEMVVPREQN